MGPAIGQCPMVTELHTGAFVVVPKAGLRGKSKMAAPIPNSIRREEQLCFQLQGGGLPRGGDCSLGRGEGKGGHPGARRLQSRKGRIHSAVLWNRHRTPIPSIGFPRSAADSGLRRRRRRKARQMPTGRGPPQTEGARLSGARDGAHGALLGPQVIRARPPHSRVAGRERSGRQAEPGLSGAGVKIPGTGARRGPNWRALNLGVPRGNCPGARGANPSCPGVKAAGGPGDN